VVAVSEDPPVEDVPMMEDPLVEGGEPPVVILVAPIVDFPAMATELMRIVEDPPVFKGEPPDSSVDMESPPNPVCFE
jgi:hypothetical protein